MNKAQFLKLYQGKVVTINNAVDKQAFQWYVDQFFKGNDLRTHLEVSAILPIYVRCLVRMSTGEVLSYSQGRNCFGASPSKYTYENPQLTLVTFFNDLLAVDPFGELVKYGKQSNSELLNKDTIFYEVGNDGVIVGGSFLASTSKTAYITSKKTYPCRIVAFCNGKSIIKWEEGDDAGKLSTRLWKSEELQSADSKIASKFKVGDPVLIFAASSLATVSKIIQRPFGREGVGYHLYEHGTVVWYDSELAPANSEPAFITPHISFADAFAKMKANSNTCALAANAEEVKKFQDACFAIGVGWSYSGLKDYNPFEKSESIKKVGILVNGGRCLTWTSSPDDRTPIAIAYIDFPPVAPEFKVGDRIIAFLGDTCAHIIKEIHQLESGLRARTVGGMDFTLKTCHLADEKIPLNPNEVLAPATPATPANFKVGDKVRSKTGSITYTVTKVLEKPTTLHDVGYNLDGATIVWFDNELKLAPAVKAIYVVIKKASNANVGDRCYTFEEILPKLNDKAKPIIEGWSRSFPDARYVEHSEGHATRIDKGDYETYVLAE